MVPSPMLTGVQKPAALRHAGLALASSIALVTNLGVQGGSLGAHGGCSLGA